MINIRSLQFNEIGCFPFLIRDKKVAPQTRFDDCTVNLILGNQITILVYCTMGHSWISLILTYDNFLPRLANGGYAS